MSEKLDYIDTFIDGKSSEIFETANWFISNAKPKINLALDCLYNAVNISNSAWEGEAADNFRNKLKIYIQNLEDALTYCDVMNKLINTYGNSFSEQVSNIKYKLEAAYLEKNLKLKEIL